MQVLGPFGEFSGEYLTISANERERVGLDHHIFLSEDSLGKAGPLGELGVFQEEKAQGGAHVAEPLF